MARRMRRQGGRTRRGTTVREVLSEAIRHQEAGRPADAEALCRSILEVRPDQPQALFLLGVSCWQSRRDPAAVASIQRAIEHKPDFARAYDGLGQILRELGRVDEAVAAHRKAIELDPGGMGAYQGLGATLLQRGEIEPGLEAYRRAVELAPNEPKVAAELISALRRIGRGGDALAVARESALRSPDSHEAHTTLAIESHNEGLLEAAADHHRRAIALAPESAIAHTNLGVTLHALGDLEEATRQHQRATELDPKQARAQSNLGLAHLECNRLEEAVDCFGAALAVEPGNAGGHFNRALALLGAGRLAEGWEEFEWRWRSPGFPSRERHTDHPRWDGSALSGRRLLVYSEQGIGDTIQFARYLPMLARPGARLLVECAPEVARLLGSLAGVEAVVERGRAPGHFDVQIPRLSLPRLFGTTLASVPARIPYLAPDPADVVRWRDRTTTESGLRAGLVWAGSATHNNDHHRSIAPELLGPLLETTGVHWFGLQVGERASPPPPGPMTDLSPHLRDFADTAAAIASLDLVVTVDTAVAHLAGAIGARVWTLLPHAPDWRWLKDREDSPWYPTMRLFRQPARGTWKPVIERVCAELDREMEVGQA
jgi:tetratricopeptide (TPR) repeat protein